MSRLNANASEWRPSGNPLGDFALPPASEAMENSVARANGVSVHAAAFTPNMSTTTPARLPTPAPAAAAVHPYYPSFSNGSAADAVGGVLGHIDWKVEFDKVMRLTEEMIEQQLNPPPAVGASTAAAVPSGGAATPAAAGKAVAAPPAAAAATAVTAATITATTTTTTPKSSPAVVAGGQSPAPTKTYAAAVMGVEVGGGRAGAMSEVSSMAPLTANGNRRWKKPTKAQQKRELAQRKAFEAFASALLHSVSPFMAPLRAKCRKALPHLKIDQRFGKSGQPQTAVAQFVAAPLVTNYRPRHFHDVSPGDLEEFMWELAHVLDVVSSSYSLIIGYGPVWKRYAVPYMYIACKEYAKEVRALCPDEVPNSRAEAMYEDDVVKDITDIILSVEELDFLMEMSLIDAMKARAKFQPMFDAFDQVFSPLENYQIELTNLRECPSRFLLKVSQLQVDQKSQPIVLYNDPKLWSGLREVSRVVKRAAKGAGEPRTEEDMDDDNDDEEDEEDEEEEGEERGSGPTAASGVASGGRSARKVHASAQGRHGAGNDGADGVPTWLVVTPVVLSVLCAAATVTILLTRKSA